MDSSTNGADLLLAAAQDTAAKINSMKVGLDMDSGLQSTIPNLSSNLGNLAQLNFCTIPWLGALSACAATLDQTQLQNLKLLLQASATGLPLLPQFLPDQGIPNFNLNLQKLIEVAQQNLALSALSNMSLPASRLTTLDTNSPTGKDIKSTVPSLSPTGDVALKTVRSRVKSSKRSKFRGVYWNKGSRSWRSLISINGKTQHLGNFATQEEAAQEFDRRARELKRTKLNFPDDLPPKFDSITKANHLDSAFNGKQVANSNVGDSKEYSSPMSKEDVKAKARAQYPSSRYRGVYFVKQRNEWRARIWNDGKSEHLGNFATEEEAAREFDRRSKELGRDNLNFPDSP